MKNKPSLIFRVGILVLVLTSFGIAQRHHLTFTGANFNGDSTDEYLNSGNSVSVQTTSHALLAPVSFPDSANGMQVTRLSCTVWDNSVSGRILVSLLKVDRWTGSAHRVGKLETGLTQASNSLQYLNLPKSQMMARGIDNNRWAWYLEVYFSEGYPTLLQLYHVTIRYE